MEFSTLTEGITPFLDYRSYDHEIYHDAGSRHQHRECKIPLVIEADGTVYGNGIGTDITNHYEIGWHGNQRQYSETAALYISVEGMVMENGGSDSPPVLKLQTIIMETECSISLPFIDESSTHSVCFLTWTSDDVCLATIGRCT